MAQIRVIGARWRELLPGRSSAEWRKLVGWLYLLAVSGWILLVVSVVAFWQSGPIFVIGVSTGALMGLVGNVGRYACDHCASVRFAEERAAGYSTISDGADGVDFVASNGFVLNPAGRPRTQESRSSERARLAAARESLENGAIPKYEPLPHVVRVDGFGPLEGLQRAKSPSRSWRNRDRTISLLVVSGWTVPIVLMTWAWSTDAEAAERGSHIIAIVVALAPIGAFFFSLSILRALMRRARVVRAAIEAQSTCTEVWLVHGAPSTGAELARLNLMRPAQRRELGWMVLGASSQHLSLWTSDTRSLAPLMTIPWNALDGVEGVETKFYGTDARAAVLRLSDDLRVTVFVCNPRWRDIFFMGKRQLAEYGQLLERHAS